MVRTNDLCVTEPPGGYFDNSWTFVWAGVAAQQECYTGEAIAQSGYYREEGHLFVQHFAFASYCEDPTPQYVFLNGAAEGTRYKYWSRYDSACSCIKVGVDGSLLMQSDFNPNAQWNGLWEAQFAGETKHTPVKMPGTNSQRSDFQDLSIYQSGAWTPAVGAHQSFNDDPTAWGQTPVTNFCTLGSRCFGIWSW